ncbi:MAG TPA: ABC transporter ATP-binding protein [Rhizomicrobium sp.]|jgi:spermidine/putrescine transport system ATP-binding protein/putrescine transport system ATP-binding protein|nr:ABC transporter ATP-binding protein [Rhizomicrobium sp.]
MSDSEFIRIDHVSKRFGSVIAVDDADLSIRRGEFFSLLGPSGCGKTTLLRMLAGFEFPSAGEIYVEGARITDMPPHLRPSNMVFQSYAIFPHLNVFDNIAYGLRKARLARGELKRRVDEALAMIKLDGFGARRGDELSGGQRQRVALARALVCRPKVLLLDEPLGALDKRLREAMQIELRQLQKSVGITFVFVTHDQEEALSMSDRVAVMSGGRILQIASPRELYEAPNCREVADFIGEINFFDGVVTAPGAIDAGVIGRVAARAGGAVGTKVLVALRPEKIALSAESGTVRGTVVSAAYLGERSHYAIAIEGRAEPVAVSAQNVEKTVTRGHAPGDIVYLSWAPDAVVVLPGE